MADLPRGFTKVFVSHLLSWRIGCVPYHCMLTARAEKAKQLGRWIHVTHGSYRACDAYRLLVWNVACNLSWFIRWLVYFDKCIAVCSSHRNFMTCHVLTICYAQLLVESHDITQCTHAFTAHQCDHVTYGRLAGHLPSHGTILQENPCSSAPWLWSRQNDAVCDECKLILVPS